MRGWRPDINGAPWDFTSSAFSYAPVRKSDLSLLYVWLQQPHIVQWWQTPSKSTYLANACEDLANPHWTGFVVRGDIAALGYIQTWRQGLSDDPWWPCERRGMVSIDLFIVTEDLCNKGLGTQILT